MNARQYAENAHGNQTRWDGRPYIVHPDKVASIIKSWKITDDDIINAAYLHDVVEDTNKTVDDIEQNFGVKTAQLVRELTFPPKVSDEEYLNICKTMSKDATLIKIADILANITGTGTKSPHFIQKRLIALSELIQKYYNIIPNSS